MIRLKIGLIILGGFLAFMGYEEFNVSQSAASEPTIMELSAIENSPELENNWVQVGSHWAVFPACIYEYEMSKYDTGEPDNSTKVNVTYYPIISNQHPFLTQIDALAQEYGGEENIPDDKWPAFDSFTVLVKTKAYSKIGAIPVDWTESDGVQGLIVNRIETLNAEEEGLIRQSFPYIDMNKVLILEQNREPSSAGKSMGMMAGGLAVIIAGLFWLFKR